MYNRYELEVSDDEEEDGFDLSRSKPKYSTILQEEEYEDESEPRGFDKSPEENYDRSQVITWDPWEPSYFFPIL
jgi:hypothetical protein